jgi:ribonuclease HI
MSASGGEQKSGQELASQLPSVTIYTDGAAEPNPGPGGYGVVVLHPKKRLELSGGFQKTTNNRMELMGVIVGLEALKTACRVFIYSDSKYVVDSISKGWLQKWEKRRWVRRDVPVPNADLWQRYLVVAGSHTIEINWIKGHAGHEHNERCDVLAVEAAKGTDMQIDYGYRPNVTPADSESLGSVPRDWRRSLGMFDDHPAMKQIDEAGQRIRQEDRDQWRHNHFGH